MSTHGENPSMEPRKRWYDADPALQQAMNQLRSAPDQHQAQVALNIIKIIVEHQMEDETDLKVEDLGQKNPGYANWQNQKHRRWYDVHETLGSAIQLFLDCPPDLQQQLIPSIVQMIESTLDSPAH